MCDYSCDYECLDSSESDNDHFDGENNCNSGNIIKKKKKRDVWTDDEIASLLDLVIDLRIVEMLDSKKHRSNDVYQLVADGLQNIGYTRTFAQTKNKIKLLKKEYTAAKRCLNTSGESSAARSKLKYFDKLDEIYGQRPVVNSRGIDSLNPRFTKQKLSEQKSGTDGASSPNTSHSSDSSSPKETSKNKHAAKVTMKSSMIDLVESINESQTEMMENFIDAQRKLSMEVVEKFCAANTANMQTLMMGLQNMQPPIYPPTYHAEPSSSLQGYWPSQHGPSPRPGGQWTPQHGPPPSPRGQWSPPSSSGQWTPQHGPSSSLGGQWSQQQNSSPSSGGQDLSPGEQWPQ